MEGADRGPGEAGRRRRPIPKRAFPIYKRLGRIWGEKLSRERNSLESWQKVLEIDPQDVDALRAIAANYRSAGAWEELSQALRRLIQVGQLGGSGIEPDELKELFSQLGELEGETLMRTQDSIDAWREVLELDPGRLPRAGGARAAVHAGGALGGGGRHPRAARGGAGQPDRAGRRADAGGVAVGRQDRRRRLGGRASTNACCRSIAGHQTASIELEQLYRQRKSWVKLVDLLLARTEFAPDAAARIVLLVQVAEIYEQQLNDRDSAFVTLQAAFREDYSNDHVAKELERLATAADKWNELIGDYTQVVQGIADPKQAADLWVKIARWYDSALRHVDYAIASAQQALQLDAAHIGALQALEDFFRKQKRWSDLVGALARHAECETEPTAAGRDPAAAGRHLRDAARRRDAGDGRLPARAGHRRALHRRDQRARAAVSPHAGVGPPGRRAGQEVAGGRRHRAGDPAASCRSASCGRTGWATTIAPSTPTKRCCRSIRATCPR